MLSQLLMLLLSQKLMLKPLLLLSQLPQLSQDMDMVMDMVMDILVMDMVDMDTMVTMERDLLMLSQDMDIMAMDMDMDMVMAMVMDTMAKQQFCCSCIEFSTKEVGLYRSSQKTFHLFEI